jgi:toxin HigB-1
LLKSDCPERLVLPPSSGRTSINELQQLNAAGDLRDRSIPSSNQLEPLKGDRKGQHSLRINKQWRICFGWRDGHAFDVEAGREDQSSSSWRGRFAAEFRGGGCFSADYHQQYLAKNPGGYCPDHSCGVWFDSAGFQQGEKA